MNLCDRTLTQLASLRHYWRVNLAVALGAATATAVLTGALVVGDSVRGSLRSLTLERLGRIEHAVVRDRPFRQQLAASLPGEAAPVLRLPAAVAHTGSGSRSGKVEVLGFDERFVRLFGGKVEAMAAPGATAAESLAAFLESAKARRSRVPSVLLNETLAVELGARVGDALLLSLQRVGGVHPEALFGRRGPEDVVSTLRCEVGGIVAARGPGRFSLEAHQAEPRLVLLPLPVLQRQVDLEGRANGLLVGLSTEGRRDPASLLRALDGRLQLADLGLVVRHDGGPITVESHRYVIDHGLGARLLAVAANLGIPRLAVSAYLATGIDLRGRSLPYSTVAALDAQPDSAWGWTPPTDGGLLLNDWAAADLQAQLGDTVGVHYYEVGPREELIDRQTRLVVEGVVAMEGLGADPRLTPDYPGIQEADDMSAWSAPFPVDLSRIRPRDEDYWDRHGAAPKAFVSAVTGRRLWSSRFGEWTSVRLRAGVGQDPAQLAQRLSQAMLDGGAAAAGFEVRPVRAAGLAASSGATDFGGLFIGFSLFLIVSAATLVGLLFRLGVEQRAPEIGLLLAAGFPLGAVRRRLLGEALVVAAVGCLLGMAGAAGYGWLMMAGLRTWWQAAVGTSALSMHLSASSLLLGSGLSLGVVVASMGLTLRRLGRAPARSLLAGAVEVAARRGRGAGWLGPAALLVGLLTIAAIGSADSPAVRAGLFFVAGALFLVAGLAAVAWWLRRGEGNAAGARLGSVAAAGARNSVRHPGRSLTAVGLVACACFVIVAVGAHRRRALESDSVPPGAGGFAIVAEADVPVHGDLNDRRWRLDLGLSPEVTELLGDGRIVQMRSLPGEDVSCLNLYQPGRPRLVGVPGAMVQRQGFPFAAHLPLTEAMAANPWRLLQQDLGPGVVPAVADLNSAQWILHKGLGDELTVSDQAGQPVRLRLVGLLQRSIFQSEVLIGEAAFERLYPERSGYGFLLVEAPASSRQRLISALERGLRDYGLDATTASGRLAGFLRVENTYLSTFQTLGGLGLLLGTLGLALLLLRNAFERRGELAALQAFGFRRRRLSRLLFWETALLLVAGIAIGTVAALVAAAPHLDADVPWPSLAATVALVAFTGWLANILAVRWALRRPLLPALKAD